MTEKEVTGEACKLLRIKLGITQTEFWSAVGVKQNSGCKYEQGSKVPKPVRILVVLKYVSGVDIDVSTKKKVRLLSLLSKSQKTKLAIDSSLSALSVAAENLKSKV